MPSPAVPPSSTSSTPHGPKLRVLYADDMAELRDLVKIVLGREGHVIETAIDGSAAHTRAQQTGTPFDLVITDHHMPVMNGLELVRALRDTAFPGKIMVFSSEISPVIHKQYRQLHVDRILPKPVFPATLREALRQLFPADA
ncbi:MAG: response regulator [Candidatus Didemnitutus sp.]|nr:response regulator [Candidatus Didemnitutus sp.]